jgi:hypothetical protein
MADHYHIKARAVPLPYEDDKPQAPEQQAAAPEEASKVNRFKPHERVVMGWPQ